MKKTYLLLLLLFFTFNFNSKLDAKIIYNEPLQNAKYVSIYNNIIIGFDDFIKSSDLNSLITITGSKSGIHSGKIIITEDGKRLLFYPHQPFVLDEQVEVSLNNLKTSASSGNSLTYSFHTQTGRPFWDHSRNFTGETGPWMDVNNLNLNSYAVLPMLTVTTSNNPSPGNLFLANLYMSPYPSHIMIVNNNGSVEYSKQMIYNTADFKRQDNGLMTYCSGYPLKHYAINSQYVVVDSFKCGNGYTTDPHEMRLISNGHALLMSYDPQPVDMSLVVPGGNPNATVIGLIIQEIDKNKNVVFQWRSWDHIAITDATHENLTAANVDAVHGNAIELDNDGNIMISSRHISEITKINRTTGDIIWRFGGAQNEFTFVGDTIPFYYQHDIRRIDNGNVTLFDNGNYRMPSYSRALEYTLDETNKVATLVWQFKNNNYSRLMGSVQRLKNGNTLIGWGGFNPTLTEVTQSGTTALEMTFPAGVWSYRAFKDEANLTLNIKMAIEGFYNSSSGTLNIRDTVTAYLRSSISPYNIIDTASAVVDSLSLTGDFRYFNVTSGDYYITIKHRNGLETWSKAGGESFIQTGVYLYDLTSSDTQAYGDNLQQVGSAFCIYSGDVNQDGSIELADVISVSNDAGDFISGYVNTDLNGDNYTDFFDQLIVYNNAINLVTVIKP